MGRRGSFIGRSTTIEPKDKDWFTEGSTEPPRSDAGQRPPRSPEEQREYEAFVAARLGRSAPGKLVKPPPRVGARMDQTPSTTPARGIIGFSKPPKGPSKTKRR